jgi:hypothetical protein
VQVPVSAMDRRRELAENLEQQPVNGGQPERTLVPQPRELGWNWTMTDQSTAPGRATETPDHEWPAEASPAPERQAERGKGGGKANRPSLPKRVPQTHLADGLKDDPDAEDQSMIASPSKLAGFRRAFRGGFDASDGGDT